MDKIDAFFEPAKNISLSPEELAACREHVMKKMQENPVRDAKEACPTDCMTDIDPSLMRSAQTIRLTADEAVRAEKALLSFMRDHPVDMAAAVRKREKAESPMGLFSFFSLRYSPAVAAVLVLVLGTGSLSYAAESALPGEALYSVKIHVNEKVQTALAITPEAKAYWEAKRAERRVKEAKKLADSGRLTPETSDTLIVAFNAHIANSHTNIRKVADEGRRERAEEITEKTEAVLRNQAEALRNNKAIALMFENVERATEETVMLDSSIRQRIAMNTPPADIAATNMMISDTKNSADTSSSDHSPMTISLKMDAGRRAKESHMPDADEQAKMFMEGGTTISVSSDPSLALMERGTRPTQGASSSVTSGSGSSSQQKSASSLTIRSAASAGMSIHISSRSGTPIRVDIQTDGSIDVEMISPEKPALIP